MGGKRRDGIATPSPSSSSSSSSSTSSISASSFAHSRLLNLLRRTQDGMRMRGGGGGGGGERRLTEEEEEERRRGEGEEDSEAITLLSTFPINAEDNDNNINNRSSSSKRLEVNFYSVDARTSDMRIIEAGTTETFAVTVPRAEWGAAIVSQWYAEGEKEGGKEGGKEEGEGEEGEGESILPALRALLLRRLCINWGTLHGKERGARVDNEEEEEEEEKEKGKKGRRKMKKKKKKETGKQQARLACGTVPLCCLRSRGTALDDIANRLGLAQEYSWINTGDKALMKRKEKEEEEGKMEKSREKKEKKEEEEESGAKHAWLLRAMRERGAALSPVFAARLMPPLVTIGVAVGLASSSSPSPMSLLSRTEGEGTEGEGGEGVATAAAAAAGVPGPRVRIAIAFSSLNLLDWNSRARALLLSSVPARHVSSAPSAQTAQILSCCDAPARLRQTRARQHQQHRHRQRHQQRQRLPTALSRGSGGKDRRRRRGRRRRRRRRRRGERTVPVEWKAKEGEKGEASPPLLLLPPLLLVREEEECQDSARVLSHTHVLRALRLASRLKSSMSQIGPRATVAEVTTSAFESTSPFRRRRLRHAAAGAR